MRTLGPRGGDGTRRISELDEGFAVCWLSFHLAGFIKPPIQRPRKREQMGISTRGRIVTWSFHLSARTDPRGIKGRGQPREEGRGKSREQSGNLYRFSSLFQRESAKRRPAKLGTRPPPVCLPACLQTACPLSPAPADFAGDNR